MQKIEKIYLYLYYIQILDIHIKSIQLIRHTIKSLDYDKFFSLSLYWDR